MNAQVEVLMFLAKDKNEFVRQHVAGNVNTSVEVLLCVVEASRDEFLAALSPSTAQEVLASLVTSKKGEVRTALVDRPYEPALPVLVKDKVLAGALTVWALDPTGIRSLRNMVRVGQRAFGKFVPIPSCRTKTKNY